MKDDERAIRSELASKLDLVAVFIESLTFIDKKVFRSDWILTDLATKASCMPFRFESSEKVCLKNWLFASFALWLMLINMTPFAIGVSFVDDEFSSTKTYLAVFILDKVHGVGSCSTASDLWVQKGISAICAKKVKIVIASLFGIATHKVDVVDSNISLIHNGRSTVKASLGEQFMVVEMTVGSSLVLVKGNVLEVLRTVTANEAVWMKRMRHRMYHSTSDPLLTGSTRRPTAY